MDRMYTRQGDIYIIPIVPERLVPRRLGIQLRYVAVEIVLDIGHARAGTKTEPQKWAG